MISSTSQILAIINNNEQKAAVLPNYIHFIWAGGRHLIPSINREAVINWAKENPEFTIFIWVDLLTTPSKLLKLYYTDQEKVNFSPFDNVILKDINTLQELRKNNIEEWDTIINNLDFSSEFNNGISSPYVRYEIDRLCTNFGASSDILRYRILYQLGGAYFDSDINPGKLALGKLFANLNDNNKSIMMVGTNSQHKKAVGNDAFVCTIRNNTMKLLYENAEQHYHIEHIQIFDDQPIIYVQHYDNGLRKDNTIKMTGPAAVRKVLLEQNLIKDQDQLPSREYCLTDEYYTPFASNSCDWLVIKYKPISSLDEAIDVALQTIVFEANTLGYMRFDEHVKHIAYALKIIEPKNNEEGPFDLDNIPVAIKNIADRLLIAINHNTDINKNNIKTVHYLTKFPEFADYYKNLPHIKWHQSEISWFTMMLKELEPSQINKLFLANLPSILNCLSREYTNSMKDDVTNLIDDNSLSQILIQNGDNQALSSLKAQFENIISEQLDVRTTDGDIITKSTQEDPLKQGCCPSICRLM